MSKEEGSVPTKGFILTSVSPFALGNEIARVPETAVSEPKEAQAPAVKSTTKSEPKAEPKSEPKPDLGKLSPAARIAMSYQKNDKFIGDDVEIKSDMTWAELKDLVKTAALSQAVVDKETTVKKYEDEALEKLRAKGATEQQLQYSEYLAKGGSPNTVPLHAKMKAWATAELKNEDEYEKVIRETLSLEGNRKELIDKYMEGLTDEESLKAEAKKMQERLAEMSEDLWAEAQEEIKAKETAAATAIENEKKEIKTLVANGFKGHKLSPTEAEDFSKFLTEFSETIEIDINGEKHRRKVTPLQKKEYEIGNDKESWLERALYIFRGFNKIEDQAIEKVVDQYLDGIQDVDDDDDVPPNTEITPQLLKKKPFALLQI